VLLIERADDLVLVDTGFGTADVRRAPAVSKAFTLLVQPRLDLAETALSQVRERGYDPSDVRHIVFTHLDVDHGGGLPDFPQAHAHVFSREHEARVNPIIKERFRYAIGKPHWAHRPRWEIHDLVGDEWLGFESVRVLPGEDPDVLMIPLAGHTLGHCGIAVRRGDGWLLHCGDAYFHRDEIKTPPRCPRGLAAFQALTATSAKLRAQNQERLRELARRRGGEVELICSHDPGQLEEAQRRAGP
jgi:glyoxylase-like metal-dependent hydrolase (beta-lactamase superfamily II)